MRSGDRCVGFADVFVPERWFFSDEVGHHLHALVGVEDDNIDTMVPEKIFGAHEGSVLANDHALDAVEDAALRPTDPSLLDCHGKKVGVVHASTLPNSGDTVWELLMPHCLITQSQAHQHSAEELTATGKMGSLACDSDFPFGLESLSVAGRALSSILNRPIIHAFKNVGGSADSFRMSATEAREAAHAASRAPRQQSLAIIVVAVALFAAVGFAVVGSIKTSSARVAASTDSDGFVSAGTIEISQPTSNTEFFFDATNLYPGRSLVGCIEIDYAGSIAAGLRLTARTEGGTGLDRYIDLRLATRADNKCPDEMDEATSGDLNDLFVGRLSTFWQTHNDYPSGLEITSTMSAGDGVAVVAVVEVIDDNDAAGKTVDLTFVFESRPS